MKKTNNIYPKLLVCTTIALAACLYTAPAQAIFDNYVIDGSGGLGNSKNNSTLQHWQSTGFGGGGGGISSDGSAPGEKHKNPYELDLPTKKPDLDDGLTVIPPDDEPDEPDPDGSGGGNDGDSLPNVTGGDPTELDPPAANDPGYNIPTKNGINYRIKQ